MIPQLLPFLGVAVVVICSPGPDTALTVRNALGGGRRAGIFTSAGVALGQMAWTVATSLGIAALVLASAWAFEVVKLLGVLYLIYLGVRTLWSAVRGEYGGGIPGASIHGESVSAVQALRQGFLSDVVNPKMPAFFLSLLPQFVRPGEGSLFLSLVLGGIFCVMTFLWLTVYSVVVDLFRDVLARGKARRIVEAVTGTLLIAFGVVLGFEQRP